MKIRGLQICLGLALATTVVVAQPRITHGPYLQAMGENEVTVVWTTDKPAVSWIEMTPNDGVKFYANEHPQYFEMRDGNRVVGQLHRITLRGLTKGTTYRYRAYSKEVLEYHGQHDVLYGKVSATSPTNLLTFTTADYGKQDANFIIVNDIHGRNDDLKALCANVVKDGYDAVIFNGDMVSYMTDEDSFFEGFMDEAVAVFASRVPIIYSRGNHETRGAFNASFADYFPSPTGKPYFSYRQGPVHIIVLDSGEDKPDSDIEYSGLAQFDAYRSEQVEWLRKELQTEAFRSAKYHLVIIHIAPRPDGPHGSLEVHSKFLPVLNNAGITAMFCGHEHHYEYLAPNADHNYPVVINSFNTSLELHANDKGLKVEQKDITGKVQNSFNLN